MTKMNKTTVKIYIYLESNEESLKHQSYSIENKALFY